MNVEGDFAAHDRSDPNDRNGRAAARERRINSSKDAPCRDICDTARAVHASSSLVRREWPTTSIAWDRGDAAGLGHCSGTPALRSPS